jgi:hypothetical protein
MSGGERPERLSIRLFGPLTIVDGQRALGARDLGGSRPKQVLEILLAARGHLMPSERLAELLWGAAPPRNPTGSLQTIITVLRQRLVPDRDRGRELIVTEAEAYRCSADLIELDLDRFDTLPRRPPLPPRGDDGSSIHGRGPSLPLALFGEAGSFVAASSGSSITSQTRQARPVHGSCRWSSALAAMSIAGDGGRSLRCDPW